MIAGFFMFNSKGEVLISKLFREGVKRNVSEVIRIQVISNQDVRSPILTLGSTTFLHTRLGSLWVVCVSRSNVDASAIFEFLSQFVDLLTGLLLGDININGGNGVGKGVPKGSSETDLSISSFSSSTSNRQRYIVEEDIKNNFSLIYEILDEMIQFGYPQTTDIQILKLNLSSSVTISNSSNTSSRNGSTFGLNNYGSNGKKANSASGDGSLFKKTLNRTGTLIRKSTNTLSSSSPKIIAPSSTFPSSDPDHIYSDTPWRQKNIRYRKNEVLVDVIEEISVLMSPNGDIVRSFVDGRIKINSRLSGMPICSFGMQNQENINDLTNCTFHQCVNLKDYDEERLIKFTPPDGEFDLMKYKIDIGYESLPFIVKVNVSPYNQNLHNNKIDFTITVKSNLDTSGKSLITCKDLKIKIPTPPNTIDFKVLENQSSAKPKFQTDENMIAWNIKKFPMTYNNTISLDCYCEIAPSNAQRWTKPPVQLSFDLEKYSTSGQLVKYLKVEDESNYSTVKWVTYRSQARSFEVRY